MNETSDRDIIDRCLAGNTAAFGELVHRYQHRLYGSLMHVTGSADHAADAVQDAFVQAFQQLSTFRGASHFYSWLFRIAFNAAVSAQRKRRRLTTSLNGTDDDHEAAVADHHENTMPSALMEIRERQQQVRDALAELHDDYRNALVLKELEGLRYEEIADLLKVPVGTIRSRIHRARQELRQKLEIVLRRERDGM